MRYGNGTSILKIAIEYGCKTAKDLAEFLREYNPQVFTNENGREIIRFSY